MPHELNVRRHWWQWHKRRTGISAYPGDEAVVGAVHRLPPGDELEEEDAEREHVRLLVHDAVREVLGRQAPVVDRVSTSTWLTTFPQSPRGRKKVRAAHPNVPSMGAMAWCVHSDGSHRAKPKSEICTLPRMSHGGCGRLELTARTEDWERERVCVRDHYYIHTCGWKSSVSRMLDALMSRWMIRRAHPLWR
jgi:hypothetical protein